MKDELKAMEAYLKELGALKRYDEVKMLSQEVSELKARLSEIQGERDRLEGEVLDSNKAKKEIGQLKEALDRAQEELSTLKEAKAILNGGSLSLEQAAKEFVKAKEAEIRIRVESEFEGLKKDFEAKAPQLIYQRLLAILEKPEWPVEIVKVIEEKAEEKAQSRLDDEFQRRVNEEALGRLQQLKLTEWQPFVEEEASHLVSSLRALVEELQGTWRFICDRCQTRVSVDIGPRQIAAMLKGQQIAECPHCTDFNLPPAPPIAPHKIEGSTLENVLQAYLDKKGPPGKTAAEGT
jgi:hypothetical protein